MLRIILWINILRKIILILKNFRKRILIILRQNAVFYFLRRAGLLQTAIRDFPDIINVARKIEGPHTVYPYLKSPGRCRKKGSESQADRLSELRNGMQRRARYSQPEQSPLMKLNTTLINATWRCKKNIKRSKLKKTSKKVNAVISTFWKPGLYGRKYTDRSENTSLTNRMKLSCRKYLNR